MSVQTIFVRKLPATASNERLAEIFSEVGPVKHCFVVKEKGAEKCRGFGYVTYAMQEDATRALKEVSHYDGEKITVAVAKRKVPDKKKKEGAPQEPPPAKEKRPPNAVKKIKKKAQLIIRNLSFNCSVDDLKQTFAKFGTVLEAKIPLKQDGKMRGFAFVLFKNLLEAGKALNAMNLKEIKGRQVAVDWAVAKDKFVATQTPSNSGPKKEEKVAAGSDSEDDEEEEGEEEKPVAPQEEKKPVAPQKNKGGAKPAQVDPPSEDEGEEEQSEEEEEDDEEEDEGEEEEEDAKSQEGDEDDDDDDQSDLGSDDEDEDEDDDEYDDDDDDDDEDRPTKKKNLPSDINQGKTIFIRNLSFDTEEEGLEEVLLRYGELKYIKIVVHPVTDHSKGCAFAQFKSKDAAEKCIAASQDESETGGIRVDGRKLTIVAAVTKEDAAKLNDKKVKVESGTRNLYLAREGLIRAGTKAAEGVPEADMVKRARFEELKRTKLRDINVFVSKTRLCVHNLPKAVDVKQLRKICLKAAGGGKEVRITECRVMYDKAPVKGQPQGQSLGYAFVQFRDHEHALKTLRHLNNNPDIHGSNKRPIVEFSLEDGRKLKMKEERQQQYKARFGKAPPGPSAQPQAGGGGGAGGGAGTRKGVAGQKVAKATGEEARPSSSDQGKDMVAPVQAQNQGQNQAQNQKQGQGQGGFYAGFQTKPEVEHVELEEGKKRRKVLPFPSHRGPKNRLRDKGKQQAPPPKKPKAGPSRRERQGKQLALEKHSQPRTQNSRSVKKRLRNRDDDRFDSLVEQYKKKLTGSSGQTTAVKRSKWFN